MCTLRLVGMLPLLLATQLSAQIGPPTLLRDLDTRAPEFPASSGPWDWTPFGGQLWFLADDVQAGRELHVTDGTVAGTRLVADLTPGRSAASWSLTATGNHLFFVVGDGLRSGLWAVDSTPGATPAPVFLIGDAAGEDGPGNPTAVGNRLFFTARDPLHGLELWSSDGTTTGTSLVADVEPGARSSSPYSLAPVGNRLLFSAQSGNLGREFWATDGTAAGTNLLVDSGMFGSSNSDFVVVAGELNGRRLFFAGDRLYVTDGTPGGTSLLRTGIESDRYVNPPGVLNGSLYFVARAQGIRALWRSDGTTTGTVQVRALGSSRGWPIGVVGGRVLFEAAGLYATDGTVAGTRRVGGIAVRSTANGTTIGGVLVFMGSDGSLGVFATDGTSAWRLQNGFQSTGQIDTTFGGRVWFATDDGSGIGLEPWTSDGTVTGTGPFADLARWPTGATRSSDPRGLTSRATGFAFLADTTDRYGLWHTDGTAAGTVTGPTIPGDPFGHTPDGRLIGRADKLFALTIEPQASRDALLHADSGAGPVQLARIASWNGSALWQPHRDGVVVVDDDLLISDGSAVGTRQIVLDPAASYTGVGWAASAGATLLVAGYADADKLFRIDGDTVTVITVLPGYSDEVQAADGFVFFNGSGGNGDDPNDVEPWVSDGTAAGTHLLLDLVPGSTGSYSRAVCRMPGGLVFYAYDGSGDSLWFTDGTPPGTLRLPDVFGSGYFTLDGEVFLLGASLLVPVTDAAFGAELKILAPSGALLLDLNPGTGSSNPRLFEQVGEELWFVADTTATGRTLYRTDGTLAGTQLVAALDSEPNLLSLRNGRVWLDLDDIQHGRELWSFDPGAVTETTGHACGAGLELPRLEATDPVLGQPWTISGAGGAAGQPGLLALGLRANQPQRVAGWCWTTLDLSTAVVVRGIPDSSGAWSWTTILPADPALQGLGLAIESWHAEPGGPSGLGTSAARFATFGVH